MGGGGSKHRSAWACLASVGAFGCSLSDFVGTRPMDAGAEAADVTSIDAGVEADVRSTDGATGSCAKTFCDDFDHGTVGERWDAPPLEGSGLSIDGVASVSPPSSLLIRYGNQLPALMTKSFPAAAHVRLDLDIMLVAAAPAAVISISTLRPGNGETFVTFEYRSTGLNMAICTKSGCATTKNVGALSTNRFRHLSVDANLKGGGVGVTLDGISVIKDAGPIPPQPANGVIYELGDSIVSSETSEFRVDNVVIDIL